MAHNLSWYVNRLKTMSIPEIGFRVRQFAQNKYEAKRMVSTFPEVALSRFPDSLLDPVMPDEWTINNEQNIFGKQLDYSQPINWHEDIHNGRSFPMLFSRSIDTRSERFGVVKNVWEVNRLQFLPKICIQYRLTGDSQYLDQFRSIMESWAAENPYLLGVNWYSNIEVNLRLITWFLCWEILDVNSLIEQKPEWAEFVQQTWTPLIYLHAKYAHDHPSKFSSSNNHLIAEGAGLFVASVYWSFKESAQWEKAARKILEREIQLQHSKNGINREEASEYIQFITDFFLICYIVGERAGKPLSAAYGEMLQKIFHYIYQMMDIGGQVPYYGDDDDGRTWILDDGLGHPNNFASILTAGAILFKDPILKTRSAGMDTRNMILFGEKGRQLFESLPAENRVPETVFYKEEGHFFCKAGDDTQEVYLHVDAAPLGYLSIAAHGHADALSFFLRVDGQPIFADMGTYTYHSEPEWRDYFKGTLAHNTIRVDGVDQARAEGPCLWLDHYEVALLKAEQDAAQDIIIARHSGYAERGVIHTRSYHFDKIAACITIEDSLEITDANSHTFEIPLHLHPDVSVEQASDHTFVLRNGAARAVRLKPDPQLTYAPVRGQESPLLGWHSPSFLQREETTVLYARIARDTSFKLLTEIIIEPAS